MERARNGDSDAFGLLVRQCSQSMYKVAKGILYSDEDVADAVQEAVIRAWEKLGDLQKNEFFKTWLIRILINECRKIYRREHRDIPEAEFILEAEVDSGFANAEWELFLTGLDEKYRIVILLYYGEGWKVREIAEILEISQSAVKKRLVEARKRVMEMYEKKEEGRRYNDKPIQKNDKRTAGTYRNSGDGGAKTGEHTAESSIKGGAGYRQSAIG